MTRRTPRRRHSGRSAVRASRAAASNRSMIEFMALKFRRVLPSKRIEEHGEEAADEDPETKDRNRAETDAAAEAAWIGLIDLIHDGAVKNPRALHSPTL